jgi:hypothetical protein
MTLIDDINIIKSQRRAFINSFELNLNLIEILKTAANDNNLNSIRVHKYLTDGGLIGKVKTARFLETIQLSEKTHIKDLSDQNINDISLFVSSL